MKDDRQLDRNAGAPEPLVELDARGELDERATALARLFRRARAAQSLDHVALVRVRARLREGSDHASPPRRAAWLRTIPLTIALLALAGSAIAVLAKRLRDGGSSLRAPVSTGTGPSVDVAPVSARSAPAAAPTEAAAVTSRGVHRTRSAAAAAPAATAPRKASPSPSSSPDPTPAPPPRAPSGSLAEETRLLQIALTSLRRDRDAAAALAALDRYDWTFPAGLLFPEAARARVDALFLLGRTREAAAALDALLLAPRGRDLELLLVRAELRAPHDCSTALPDFESVLAAVASTALAERALHGVAVCRAKQGDLPGAERAFQDYLRRFPTGRFAPAAHRALGR
jgi:hypothetical protein